MQHALLLGRKLCRETFATLPLQPAYPGCKSVQVRRRQNMIRHVMSTLRDFESNFRRCIKDDLILERCALKGPIPVMLRRSAIAFMQCQCGQK